MQTPNQAPDPGAPSAPALKQSHIGGIFRATCFAGAILLSASLFWLGSKPVAVGLFPAPIDKLAHFATFGLIASLLWLSILRGRPLLVISLVGLLGASDELHQRFLPGRSAGLDDWAADVFSAMLITGLLELARRLEGRRQ